MLYDCVWLRDLHFHPLLLFLMIQINPAVCEGDMFRYFAQSIVALTQLAFEKACENNATIRPSSGDQPCEEDGGVIGPHGNAFQAQEVYGGWAQS